MDRVVELWYLYRSWYLNESAIYTGPGRWKVLKHSPENDLFGTNTMDKLSRKSTKKNPDAFS